VCGVKCFEYSGKLAALLSALSQEDRGEVPMLAFALSNAELSSTLKLRRVRDLVLKDIWKLVTTQGTVLCCSRTLPFLKT
jgi:hypothetical protein